jgi:hypothetical protein
MHEQRALEIAEQQAQARQTEQRQERNIDRGGYGYSR